MIILQTIVIVKARLLSDHNGYGEGGWATNAGRFIAGELYPTLRKWWARAWLWCMLSIALMILVMEVTRP